ncbi:MAG: hypothetical protein QOJ62_1503 [Actinomycetota bacterium]|nr:hypothetical protein [Actinomycetota bacterium]
MFTTASTVPSAATYSPSRTSTARPPASRPSHTTTPSQPGAGTAGAKASGSPLPTRSTTAVPPTVGGPVASKSALPATTTAGYKLFTNPDGSVVRWNPCAPIHYSANIAQATDPAGALRDLQAAVASVAAASGLTFAYDGPTTTIPTKAWLNAGGSASRIVVAWAPAGSSSGHSDLFGSDADGEGGWWESGTSVNGARWVWQIMRGFVVVDPVRTATYAAGFGTGTTRGALLMHEFAHAIGLGHATDRRDLMFPLIGASTRAVWGPGDLLALKLVGGGAGCIA